MSFKRVCAIAYGEQTFQSLEKLSNSLDRSTATEKPSTLVKVESITAQTQHLELFSDKAVGFIGLNKESGLCLGLNHRYPLST